MLVIAVHNNLIRELLTQVMLQCLWCLVLMQHLIPLIMKYCWICYSITDDKQIYDDVCVNETDVSLQRLRQCCRGRWLVCILLTAVNTCTSKTEFAWLSCQHLKTICPRLQPVS